MSNIDTMYVNIAMFHIYLRELLCINLQEAHMSSGQYYYILFVSVC